MGSKREYAMMQDVVSLQAPSEYTLTTLEKKFLLYAERGDCASVKRIINENTNKPDFDLNCVDPLNRSALIAAIENENIELIRILLAYGIKVKDSLLHAIKEEYVEGVEALLEHEEKTHRAGEPYSWEAVDRAQSTFTTDITPLILAAHMNNYEIIKILLDRGASLPSPHDVRCGCDDCVLSSDQDSLRHSQARINAYKALSSPSLIALSSRDPLLTAFELSRELSRLRVMENEFREEYDNLRKQVQTFATSLLDHARTSYELDVMLNYDPDEIDNIWEPGKHGSLERLKLGIKYKQKNFTAHPNVQQLLASMWYEGLPGFRRKNPVNRIMEVAKLAAMFPFNSLIYMLAPNSSRGKIMTKPFIKFITHSASYMLFLMLLGAASQRVEVLAMEWIAYAFDSQWMQDILTDWARRERGSIPGFVEFGCIIYVTSLVAWEIRSLWADGIIDYISDLWNIIDLTCNMFYVTWIALRGVSHFITWREYWQGLDPYYPREDWDPFDPYLLAEGMFAAGMIFSFLKLVHIFSINPHLGPLQISLGRMIIDILKFFFIYTLVLFAFGCGMNQLLWYYSDLEQEKCYGTNGIADFENQDKSCTIWRRFSNMFETSQSLFWASFGLVDLVSFELAGIKSFTRFWALLMFGSYSVINVIVLLNMLIAMMSNSYQIISERSDIEWKFARSKLWISYFEEDDILPPPFNLFPSVSMMSSAIKKKKKRNTSIRACKEKAERRHETVMKLLVRRYVTAEQRKRDEFGITEDDVMEIRQDISTLRFELVDILRTNGMKTPVLDPNENNLAGKKGKQMERRLLKDFQIGYVEGVVNEAIQNEKGPKDVFSRIARAIGGKRPTSASKKKDWNAQVQRRNSRKDPIGSTSELVVRRSRQSIRKHILENKANVDSNRLVEYNPRLVEVSPAARIAYAKFKLQKIKKEYEDPGTEAADDEVFTNSNGNGGIKNPPTNKITSILKSSVSSLSSVTSDPRTKKPETVVQMESEVPKAAGAPKPPERSNSQVMMQRKESAKKAPEPPTVHQPSIKVSHGTPPVHPKQKQPAPMPSQASTASGSSSATIPAPRPAASGVPARRRGVSPIPEERGVSPSVRTPQPGGKSTVTGKIVDGWI
ncbi:transient receptor potential protein-like [Cloeon dipterum]|uniref:transient receptor potential protein-like n=1 Tax=Cloeon dipterum TaxID=197152 RepID=UPI0032205C8E